jgi:Rad3-related DNA helicase
VLNTGAGKTLVGLLAAQSYVNETRGKVLYACSSIQLVDQTAAKAAGYGINVATYVSSQWTKQEAYNARKACVTTYQALFNGRSRFFRREEIPDVVIFDDSHSAEHLLRDAFSLRISQAGYPATFQKLAAVFRNYFREIGQEVAYVERLESGSGFRSTHLFHRLFSNRIWEPCGKSC